MRIPLLLDADKSITKSASTYLRNGHWRVTCDDATTTFQVVTSDSQQELGTDFRTLSRAVKILIIKRGDKSRISFYAERIGDGFNS